MGWSIKTPVKEVTVNNLKSQFHKLKHKLKKVCLSNKIKGNGKEFEPCSFFRFKVFTEINPWSIESNPARGRTKAELFSYIGESCSCQGSLCSVQCPTVTIEKKNQKRTWFCPNNYELLIVFVFIKYILSYAMILICFPLGELVYKLFSWTCPFKLYNSVCSNLKRPCLVRMPLVGCPPVTRGWWGRGCRLWPGTPPPAPGPPAPTRDRPLPPGCRPRAAPPLQVDLNKPHI